MKQSSNALNKCVVFERGCKVDLWPYLHFCQFDPTNCHYDERKLEDTGDIQEALCEFNILKDSESHKTQVQPCSTQCYIISWSLLM